MEGRPRAEAITDVIFVKQPDMVKVAVQTPHCSVGQDGNAIFEPLSITNDDLVLVEIDILDAQTNALHEAQAAAVEQLGHQLVFP